MEDPAILIPLFGIAGGTIMLGLLIAPIMFWLRNRHEMQKHKLAFDVKDPQEETKRKRLEDRLENLEAMLCRLDAEINTQLERSLSMGKLITTSTATGVSQMPTTFMNVATALEGRYQVLKELGRGGMGIVFQAHDKELKEQVAIKILSPLLSNDPEALERLKREVSAARRITHPNVIRTYDIAELKGLHYVSMEFFSGISLKEHIKQNGALSPMQAYSIASQICDGLQAAHAQGVIHRDLKSQNVILNPAGQIKIIDFGLAAIAETQGLTATGLIMGSPEYMAPEQVAGKRVDERADIYALGIVLYEIFTGRVPFSGESAISVGFQQLKDDPPPPSTINPQIPPDVESIILKALQKDPFNRFRSVGELREMLDSAFATDAGVIRQAPSSARESQRVRE